VGGDLGPAAGCRSVGTDRGYAWLACLRSFPGSREWQLIQVLLEVEPGSNWLLLVASGFLQAVSMFLLPVEPGTDCGWFGERSAVGTGFRVEWLRLFPCTV
jgi:hypothetical protein